MSSPCNSKTTAVKIAAALAAICLLCAFVVDVNAKPLAPRQKFRYRIVMKRASDSDNGHKSQKMLLAFASGNSGDAAADDHDGTQQIQAASLHEACELLVSELQTASADFSQYMRLNCPGIDAQIPEHQMPENCRQSLHEAYELFDVYDSLLQQHCQTQYEALFRSQPSEDDLRKNNDAVGDLTNENNAVLL